MSFDAHDEYRAALALRHTPGVGPATCAALAHAYGSFVEAARKAAEWPERKLVRRAVAKAFASRVWRDGAGDEYEAAKDKGMRRVVLTETRYPERLREMSDPPAVLYYDGDVSLLCAPSLAVVGARMCSRYGLQVARRICGELSAAGLCIVSGMAYGIDRQAHLGGLAGVGGSIAVLGSGLDRIYPETNSDLYRALCERGLVVSEFAPGTMPKAGHFPVRNRIIAGLALGVWVVEAAPGSGSLITARQGMEQGREVFALPGRIDDPTFTGCNELISQGAHPVSGAECILRALRYHLAHLLLDETRLARAAEAPAADRADAMPIAASAASGGNDARPPRPGEGEDTLRARAFAKAGGPRKGAAPVVASPVRAEIPADLSGEARAVLDLLDGSERLHIDAVIRGLGAETASVSALLMELEITGLVKQWPGMYYSRA